MTVRERMLSLRLLEKQKTHLAYMQKLGITGAIKKPALDRRKKGEREMKGFGKVAGIVALVIVALIIAFFGIVLLTAWL